jgi:hypothetical protein
MLSQKKESKFKKLGRHEGRKTRAYDPKQVVGAFFEQAIMILFDLVKADKDNTGEVPDLVSRTNSFFVEVKAASYARGGVINEKQLYRFDETICLRKFYAFAYHSICRDMQKDFPSPELLREALDIKSVYLFPFSIVKAYFENSKKRKKNEEDNFVQLRENQAQDIFEGGEQMWARLGLEFEKYKRASPTKKVHIVTRQGYLEEEISSSFNHSRVP